MLSTSPLLQDKALSSIIVLLLLLPETTTKHVQRLLYSAYRDKTSEDDASREFDYHCVVTNHR